MIVIRRNTSATRRWSCAEMFGQVWLWMGLVRIVIGPSRRMRAIPEMEGI